MKLINGLIERLALASTLFTAAFLAMVSPRAVVKMLINDLGGMIHEGWFSDEHPSVRQLTDDSPQGESKRAKMKLKPETE
nr:hypothetical protein 4 [Balneolaceae bacterium]